jgi:hypothetical protein
MAFTEVQLDTQIDPAATARVIDIVTMIPGPAVTDVYAVGITAPYAGKAGWVQVPNGNTAAQALALIQAAFA